MTDIKALAGKLTEAQRRFVLKAMHNSGFCLSQLTIELRTLGLCEPNGLSPTPLCLALRAHLKSKDNG